MTTPREDQWPAQEGGEPGEPDDPAARTLITGAIAALRASGRIVPRLADGTFRIDGGPAILEGAVVARGFDLMTLDDDRR